MVDLDVKDRKILYQLNWNCRQSNSQIGKKVGLSRKVVEYRINRLEKDGIITGYWTHIDSYRFGYQVYRYYIITQNATSKKKEEIIQRIADYKNTWVTGGLKGIYDINAIIWVKNIPEFYQFWDSLNEEYGDYFREKVFSVYLQADVYPLSYLLGDEYVKEDREDPEHTGMKNPISITKEDSLLLNEIATNAKISLIELGKKLDCSSQAVNYRMKKLLDNGIIQGFHAGVDYEKLGFMHFKVDLWLKQLSKRTKIWNYLQRNPNITFISTSAGYSDLELEFNIESLDRLIEYMDEVQSTFQNAVRKYTYFSADKRISTKARCFPKLSDADLDS